MILTKRIPLILFMLGYVTLFAQKKHNSQTIFNGLTYELNANKYRAIKYTRRYSSEGDNYITSYQIFNPNTGKLFQIITATNFVAEKKVVVDIEYANGGIFSHVNTEEIEYQTPSLQPFGFRGSVGELAGNNVPNQLMVKFTSNKFQNIKVVNVSATPVGIDDFYFYVLDTKN